jgi:hypothetical protein
VNIEYLEGERLMELWPQIEPLFQRCCEEAAAGELDAKDILDLTIGKRCHVFAELDGAEVTVAIAVEMLSYPKFTSANIFALGGRGLVAAHTRWWAALSEWLKANNVTAIDAWVSDAMMRILQRKFGFRKVYNHVRMPLEV